jgi:DNA-binding protein
LQNFGFCVVNALFLQRTYKEDVRSFRGSNVLSRTEAHKQQRYTKETTKKGVKKMTENADVIFIGNKPPMSYVLAIITAFSSGVAKEITLKARGQAITTAVDAAEITRSRFLKDLKVSKIAIGTQEMPPREGETKSRMVSTMEITMNKK